MSLVRLSERVSPTGGLHADGFANILGRPALDPLTLVLREAAQNIWDARIRAAGAPGPRMLVRVRTLDAAQSGVFRQVFSGGDARSAEPVTTNELSRHLALGTPIRVLEICDFGTMGPAGGTDPTADQGNFVKPRLGVEPGDGQPRDEQAILHRQHVEIARKAAVIAQPGDAVAGRPA